jgi:hypothetical protein
MRFARLTCPIFLTAVTLFVSSQIDLRAQVDTISANPNAVMLRHIWAMRGGGAGIVIAALPDINGDGRNEIGVVDNSTGRWRIHSIDSSGAADTLPWTQPSASPEPIQIANLGGQLGTVLLRPTALLDTLPNIRYSADLYRIEQGRIMDTSVLTWRSMFPGLYLGVVRYHSYDLDLDGAEELVISAAFVNRNGITERGGEIWIYRGGADFTVDTPTVIIRDTAHNAFHYDLHIGASTRTSILISSA